MIGPPLWLMGRGGAAGKFGVRTGQLFRLTDLPGGTVTLDDLEAGPILKDRNGAEAVAFDSPGTFGVFSDGRICAGGEDVSVQLFQNDVVAIWDASGAMVWEFKYADSNLIAGARFGSVRPSLDETAVVVAGNNSGQMLAIDIATKAVIWNEPDTSPAGAGPRMVDQIRTGPLAGAWMLASQDGKDWMRGDDKPPPIGPIFPGLGTRLYNDPNGGSNGSNPWDMVATRSGNFWLVDNGAIYTVYEVDATLFNLLRRVDVGATITQPRSVMELAGDPDHFLLTGSQTGGNGDVGLWLVDWAGNAQLVVAPDPRIEGSVYPAAPGASAGIFRHNVPPRRASVRTAGTVPLWT